MKAPIVECLKARQSRFMSSETRHLMDELREDHRNMAIVLDVLESTADSAAEEYYPDFELIDEIMRYMTVYSDAVHHPKEDLLYAEMSAERPEMAKGLERVEPEHDEIARLGEALRNDVEAVASGAAMNYGYALGPGIAGSTLENLDKNALIWIICATTAFSLLLLLPLAFRVNKIAETESSGS